ncbi:MAG TPA: NADH-quinone oxidoreductase subunit J [Spirochaetia bacterium]|nr:NADH-quinone oxidoreductase subunit J [Spirochaetia bacterium]
MNVAFALGAVVAVAATVMMITRRNAVHALLYFVVSLLATAVIMFVLGAAFVAALEVIVYAGAIMVLFVFVIMLIGPEEIAVRRRAWIGPSLLSLVLLAELGWVLTQGSFQPSAVSEVGPKAVGIALFGPYILGTEIAAYLLLAGLVGAFHLGRREGAGHDAADGHGAVDRNGAAIRRQGRA